MFKQFKFQKKQFKKKAHQKEKSRRLLTKAKANPGQVKTIDIPNKKESQPSNQKRMGNTLEVGSAQEEVFCCEILMIRTWDRQLLTCR